MNDGCTASRDFELPTQREAAKLATYSGADETNSAPDTSPGTEDEVADVEKPIALNDAGSSVSFYSEQG